MDLCIHLYVIFVYEIKYYKEVKSKSKFYMAHYPIIMIRISVTFNLWQTCSFQHQVNFSGKHAAMPQLLHEDHSFIILLSSLNDE